MSLISTLVPIIRSVFSRWTALQLAVSHSMGGLESEAKYEAFIEAFAQYLKRNIQPSISSMEGDIQEYLDEILDEEFNTVLDDGSSTELAQLFIRYIQLIQQGKLADVQQELQLQHSMTPAIQMSVRNKNEDESSSSSGDDEDENEMREEQSTNESKSQAMDVDEEGWTTVHRRGGGKK
jgi:pre-rRNA-processing protein TSR2